MTELRFGPNCDGFQRSFLNLYTTFLPQSQTVFESFVPYQLHEFYSLLKLTLALLIFHAPKNEVFLMLPNKQGRKEANPQFLFFFFFHSTNCPVDVSSSGISQITASDVRFFTLQPPVGHISVNVLG